MYSTVIWDLRRTRGLIVPIPGQETYRTPNHLCEMRARDVLNALERVTLFRAQAADSHRRVDDIGGDLDSAISLLDLRQQSREAVDGTSSSRLLWDHVLLLLLLLMLLVVESTGPFSPRLIGDTERDVAVGCRCAVV